MFQLNARYFGTRAPPLAYSRHAALTLMSQICAPVFTVHWPRGVYFRLTGIYLFCSHSGFLFHCLQLMLIVHCWTVFVCRRIDDDHGKAYELGGSCTKCMRGILCCWMRQSKHLELFKKGQQSKYALHSKFHLITGEEVCSTDQYEHLQVLFSS